MGAALGHRLSLSIAGVAFDVSSADLPLFEDDDRISSRFRDSSEEGRDTVEVAVRRGDPPVDPGGSVLFDAGSYKIHRTGEDRTVVFNPAADRRGPLWSAEMSRRRRRLDVAAGEGLLREGGEGPLLENPFRYPLDQLAVMYMLAGVGVLLHAAGTVIDGRGWLFAGPSGAGKTTVTRLFTDGGRTPFLSDDRIVLRSGPAGFEAWGTPWPGEAGAAVNRSAPLAGIFLLTQDRSQKITLPSAAEASRRLFPLLSVPWYDRELLPVALGFLDALASAVSFYELRFRPDADIVDLIEDFCGRQP